jgi:HlyD family secretion protein
MKKSGKRRLIFVIITFSVISLAVILYLIPFKNIGKSPGNLDTYKADIGSVMKYIEAQGVVEHQNEVLLNSPANTTVLQLLNEPGSHVKSGEIILILDRTPIMEEIESLENQLAVRRNSLEKTQLNARSTRLDLDYSLETKKLKIASIKSQLADEEQLLEVGGISPAKFDKTKQSLASAEKDLEMTKEKNLIRLKQLQAEKDGLKLQIEIQEKKLEDQKALLNKMYVKAQSDGIILKINKKAGENTKKDELLVTMSDLTSFKIIGSLDEKEADYVKPGKTIFAVLDNNEKISGKVGNVKPVIENNNIVFDVFLDQSSHDKLIPNMKIALELVTTKKDSVLRVKKGSAFSRGSKQDIYIKEDDRAVRKEIQLGLIGEQYIEIKSGVNNGDEVIISDVASIRRKNTIELK